MIFTGRNEVVAKVIFLHLFVSLFTGGVCLSACWDATPPPPRSRDASPGSRHPHPPRSRHPPEQTPPAADTPPEADSGIRSMSGRYVSYWNAFLSCLFLLTSWTVVCLTQRYVEGPYCDQCSRDTFHLSADNPNGCIACFCTGVTRSCSSTSWNRAQVSRYLRCKGPCTLNISYMSRTSLALSQR